MTVLLKIGVKNTDDLRWGIRELLALTEPECAFLQWALFPMGEGTEIIGDELPAEPPFDGKSVYEFGKQVDHSPNGIPLTWEQLLTLAEHVRQTLWGTFIACKDASSLSQLKALYLDNWMYIDRVAEEYYALVECVFQAVDSSYWLVYVREEALRRRILSTVGEQACEVISFRNSILLAESDPSLRESYADLLGNPFSLGKHRWPGYPVHSAHTHAMLWEMLEKETRPLSSSILRCRAETAESLCGGSERASIDGYRSS